ncbi:hypothetical protein MSAN_01348700 [Mycena sanguinolenta]|uniref:F-box domain-containing protein n=1 Tax=Mycena sanguinolenta TaxID=230812 RepID=A0A8H6YEJ5_9AGAR|nr:hypothetical protein MSAN_01348700 [Mycena sanguinolenta]
MPWVQFTHPILLPDDTLRILAQCPNLISASLCFIRWSALHEAAQNIPVQFSQLQSLDLSLEATFTSFDHLSTCVLWQELHLWVIGTQWTEVHLTAFQLRAPNIISLEFSDSSSLTSDDLVAAIRHTVADTPNIALLR